MKILIVGFSNSVHTARWINQIAGQDWEIKLFPSYDAGAVSNELKGVEIHHSFYATAYNVNKKVRVVGIPIKNRFVAYFLRCGKKLIFRNYRERQLEKLICSFKPDIIHSMEFQSGGYLVNRVKKDFKGDFPTWIATNWGSDIYYFGRFEKHKVKIKKVLENCDFYSCECKRDVCLAEKYGLKHDKALPVFPNAGGFDLKKLGPIRNKVRTSERRIIMLKGYQNWSGRALIALKALEKCAPYLRGYTLVVYSIQPRSGIAGAVNAFTKKTGIKTKIIPLGSSHDEMLKMHSLARISISISISDAISTSLLEAMVMGSFPIQSNTACADEWIVNNKSGAIIPCENFRTIAESIKKALIDNDLVDSAAEINWQTAKDRLSEDVIKEKIDLFYKKALKN
jgi:glycosyltransferase involved in cell wall biosynthesis